MACRVVSGVGWESDGVALFRCCLYGVEKQSVVEDSGVETMGVESRQQQKYGRLMRGFLLIWTAAWRGVMVWLVREMGREDGWGDGLALLKGWAGWELRLRDGRSGWWGGPLLVRDALGGEPDDYESRGEGVVKHGTGLAKVLAGWRGAGLT